MPTRIPLIGAGICVLGLDSRFCVDLAAKKRFVRCANVPPLGTIKPRLKVAPGFIDGLDVGHPQVNTLNKRSLIISTEAILPANSLLESQRAPH